MQKLEHPISMDLKNKTIVVIYMLYFGDMVSITPFLEVLRREAEGSRIVLVIDSRFKEAVEFNPNVDDLIMVDRHGKDKGMGGTWRIGRKIGAMHPDLLLTLHGTSRTTLMALAMHPKCWAGEEGTRFDSWFMDYPITIETYNSHAVDKYLRVLSLLGVKDLSHHGMRTYISPAWEKAASDFFEKEGVAPGSRLVGLSVGSSTPEKNWPAERFGQVAEHFAGKGMIPVFFGVPSELHLIQKAAEQLTHRYVVAAGKLSMGEFMAAAGRCDLFFTNDSGPMYVADSRGVPTVSLFGPSNAKFHHPLGPCSKAISSWDMPMEPEHVNKNIATGHYVPLTKITVEEVIAAGEEALRRSEAMKNNPSDKE
jgi:heptosyltransferase-2